MRNTSTSFGAPIPRPVTDCFLTRLWWGLAEHDRRTAELNAARESAGTIVTASAAVRKAVATKAKGGVKHGR